MRDNEAEFTALERWEKEHKDYKRLVKIPTFANFRMWKAFVVWRKNVKTKYGLLHSLPVPIVDFTPVIFQFL